MKLLTFLLCLSIPSCTIVRDPKGNRLLTTTGDFQQLTVQTADMSMTILGMSTSTLPHKILTSVETIGVTTLVK